MATTIGVVRLPGRPPTQCLSSTAPSAPRVVYLTHGEPDAADTLRGRVQRELGWRARVPEHLERVGLEDAQ